MYSFYSKSYLKLLTFPNKFPTYNIEFSRGSRVSCPSFHTTEQKSLVVTLTEKKNQRIIKWLVSCWFIFLSFLFILPTFFDFIEKYKSVLWFSIVLNANNKGTQRKRKKMKNRIVWKRAIKIIFENYPSSILTERI